MEEGTARRWHLFELLDREQTSPDDANIVLLILNHSTKCHTSLKYLWNKSLLKVAVDGGANILHKTCTKHDCLDEHIPDILSGDFDSVQLDVLEYYKQKGVEVFPTPDQDATDFTKALQLVFDRLDKNKQTVKAIITLTSLGERLDHVFANVNTLYIAEKISTIPVYMVSDVSVTWLLNPGQHEFEIPSYLLKANCGLIPVGESCSNVTTSGFKWNLDHQSTKFGDLVSTSNTFNSTQLTISTDKHLLFTMERLPK